jgi:putative lipoic acid-binding regulatory protein
MAKQKPADFYIGFKEKLDNQYTWPSLYTFKFIVPDGQEQKIRDLFPGSEITEKRSSKGNYTSLTVSIMANSSDAIIKIYKEAESVEGLIAL